MATNPRPFLRSMLGYNRRNEYVSTVEFARNPWLIATCYVIDSVTPCVTAGQILREDVKASIIDVSSSYKCHRLTRLGQHCRESSMSLTSCYCYHHEKSAIMGLCESLLLFLDERFSKPGRLLSRDRRFIYVFLL